MKLFSFAAIALVVGGVACDSSSSATDTPKEPADASTSATPPHTLTVTWSSKKADGTAGGTADVCPADYRTVKVSAQAVDQFAPPYAVTGDPFQAKFDCAAGTGTIELPTSGNQDPPPCFGDACHGAPVRANTGLYFVTLYITEGSGEKEQYAAPLVEHASEGYPRVNVDMTKSNQTTAFTFWPNAGYLLANWSLDAKTGGALTCASAGVDKVKVIGQLIKDADGNDVAGGTQFTDEFPCAGDAAIEATVAQSVGAGLSRPLAKGTYHFEMQAFAAGTLVGARDMTIGNGGVDDVVVDTGKTISASFSHPFSIQIANR